MALTLSSTVVGCLLLGFFFGRFLDSIFNTHPFFLVFGLVLGIVSIFLSFYKIIKGSGYGFNK
ncbi:MAG: AtpZ/AtpI family protein [Anaerorhabdus sp.]